MNFVFLMDPLETIKPQKDTTYALMLESYQRGHGVYYLPKGGITLKEGRISLHTLSVNPRGNQEHPFKILEETILSQEKVDVLFIRTDPPFDEDYLLDTWLLDRLPAGMTVINKPRGIRTVNEKIWVTQFTELIPKTLVSCNKEDIWDFVHQENELIVKPTDSYGGNSVFYIRKGDKNTNVILETMTSQWSKYAIVQRYIPQARQGDKRILLLNGEPLGAVLRLHKDGDHRNNFFAGGKPAATQISSRDKEIISLVKPHLKKLGLYFVGIDIIGDFLIEINVTSPTCLQEMNELYAQHLETKIIDFSEQLAGQINKKHNITNKEASWQN